MPAQNERKKIAQIVIALSLCVGGWLYFVEPSASRAADLQRKIVAAQSEAPRITAAQPDLDAIVSRVKSRASAIQTDSTLTTKTAMLYRAVSTLAREHQIHVISLRPGGVDRRSNDVAQRRQFQLEADAPFDRMAEFLGALQGLDAFIFPVSLVLNPTRRDEQRLVRAFLTCELYDYPVPAAVTELLESAR